MAQASLSPEAAQRLLGIIRSAQNDDEMDFEPSTEASENDDESLDDEDDEDEEYEDVDEDDEEDDDDDSAFQGILAQDQ